MSLMLKSFGDWLRLVYFRNPFVRAELTYLQRNVRMFRYRAVALILVGCNLLLAFTPFLTTSHYADIQFHSVVGVALMLICLGYEIRIVILAINAIEHEKQSRTWNSLLLTDVDASKIVLAKWQALMQYLMGTCFLLIVSRFTLAYSLMEYLNVFPKQIDVAINEWNRAFVYFSYQSLPPHALLAQYPQLWQIVLAVVILALLNLAQMGFLVSIGILVSFIKLNLPFIKISAALLGRTCLAIIGIVFLMISARLEMVAYLSHWYPGYLAPNTYHDCDYVALRQQAIYYDWCVVERDHRRVFEAAQVVGVTLADNGVLLAANIIRPIATWRFASRNVASSMIGWLFIALATSLNLRLAGKLVYREPPTRRKSDVDPPIVER